jgi:hypothetical protein
LVDEVFIPKFKKKQLVRISLHDKKGEPKNDFARQALPYFAQVAEVLGVNLYEKSGKAFLVYKVKVEDGTILQLTEDCLMAVIDSA